MAESTNAEHVTVSIVGTESTAGGGVAPTPSGTIAKTPAGQPNLLINVVPPAVAILVRAANIFVATLLATLTAGAAGAVSAPTGSAFKAALVTAGIAAFYETLKNLVTIFGRLEGKYPLATGSI